jgi:hypothetical protein
VDAAAVGRRRRAVDGRADQRVPEHDAGADLHEARRSQRIARLPVEAQVVGGPAQQQRVTDRVGGGEQKQQPGMGGQPVGAPQVTLLDAAAGEPEPAGQAYRRPVVRQLPQGERVAAGLGQDRLAHVGVERPRRHRGQQRPRLGLGQPGEPQLGQTGEVTDGVAGRLPEPEDDHHGLGDQPPRHEREGPRRRLVEPLRVVDDTDQRPVPGGLGQQGQYRQAYEERLRWRASHQAEHDLKRLAARRRQPVEVGEKRPAELMEGGVRQLALRLDPGRPCHGQVTGRRRHVVQQRRLADTGLAEQEQRTAAALAYRAEQPGQPLPFVSASP